jgi:DNA-binding NarL/FixJ family response regulator
MRPKAENEGSTQRSEGGNLPPDRLSAISANVPLGAAHQLNNEARPPLRPGSIRSSVISIGLIDENSFTRECITKSLQTVDDRLDIVAFPTCEQYLQNMGDQELVLYHIYYEMLKSDSNNKHILCLKKLLRLVPVIILSDTEHADSLIDMLESGARGFIPTYDTTLAQIIEIIRFVRVGGIFVPPSTLLLRSNKEKSVTAKLRSSDQFTSGELAVLEQLKLGKANKIIAYELGLSESTIKAHIGKIMKKLRVTNRTQIILQLRTICIIIIIYYTP